MNARIQEILQKHTRSAPPAISVVFKRIPKLEITGVTNPVIRANGNMQFHTFNGRVFYLDQASHPFLSLPDEVLDAHAFSHDGRRALFLLSAKNKLEATAYTGGALDERSVVTRNVFALTGDSMRLFFAFRKSTNIYVNEAYWDGTRWAGRLLFAVPSPEPMSLFYAAGELYATLGDELLSPSGQRTGIPATFVHAHAVSTNGHAERDAASGEGTPAESGPVMADTTLRIVTSHFDPTTMQHELVLRNGMLKQLGLLHVKVSGVPTSGIAAPIKGAKDIIAIRDGSSLLFFQILADTIQHVLTQKETASVYDFDLQRTAAGVTAVLLVSENIPGHLCHSGSSPAFVSLSSLRSALSSKNSDDAVHCEPGLSVGGVAAQNTCNMPLAEDASMFSDAMDSSASRISHDPAKTENKLLNKTRSEVKPGAKSAGLLGQEAAVGAERSGAVDIPSTTAPSPAFLETLVDLHTHGTALSKILPEEHAPMGATASATSKTPSTTPTKPSIAGTSEDKNTTEPAPPLPNSRKAENKEQAQPGSENPTETTSETTASNSLKSTEEKPKNDTPSGESKSDGKTTVDNKKLTNTKKDAETKATPKAPPKPSPAPTTKIDKKKCITSLKRQIELKLGEEGESEPSLPGQPGQPLAATIQNAAFLRDLIAQVLVPPIEAAINEMRVQVLAEVRQLLARDGPEGERLLSYKQMIYTGRMSQALAELVKVKDGEFEGFLSHVPMDGLEEAGAESLAELVVRLCGLLKKHGNDVYHRYLVEALAVIDVQMLGTDRVQALSAAVRGLRETERLEERFPGLSHVLYLTMRRLKQRVRRMEG